MHHNVAALRTIGDDKSDSVGVQLRLFYTESASTGGVQEVQKRAGLDSIAISLFGNTIGIDEKYSWSASD